MDHASSDGNRWGLHVEKHVDPSPQFATRGLCNRNNHKMLEEWSQPGSNRRPLACKAELKAPGIHGFREVPRGDAWIQ